MDRYPFRVEKDGDGFWFLQSVDIPQACASSRSKFQALRDAEAALGTAVAYMASQGMPVPPPSKPSDGMVCLDVPASVQAKLLLVDLVRGNHVRNADLAEGLGLPSSRIPALLDLNRPTKIDLLAAAIRVAGGRLVLGLA